MVRRCSSICISGSSPGERVGLVGHSGGGKSTLFALLQRFYDLQGGRILIDGQDIARVTQESLRAAIAVVPQDVSMFHRSVMENIRYGRPTHPMRRCSRRRTRRRHATSSRRCQRAWRRSSATAA